MASGSWHDPGDRSRRDADVARANRRSRRNPITRRSCDAPRKDGIATDVARTARKTRSTSLISIIRLVFAASVLTF
jgi:hypothetical protein